jgi:hypothetical protein
MTMVEKMPATVLWLVDALLAPSVLLRNMTKMDLLT